MSNTLLPLDRLTVRVVVDNETDTLSSVDDGIPQIPEMVTAAARLPAAHHWQGHACKDVFPHLCCGCHGYSALLTAQRGNSEHTVLFDVGPRADLWLENAERLAVDLAGIDTLFLSHWHADHSGGFTDVIAAITAARAQQDRPGPVVDLHPRRPDRRGFLRPDGEIFLFGEEPGFADLEAAGGRLVTHDENHAIADGLFFGSGEIARVTDYEQGFPGHHSFYGDDGEEDPLIMDERYLAAHVAGRGLTVLSACSHAGIVNVGLAARDTFPDTPIDLLLGGYHLAGAAVEDQIEPTVRDLAARVNPAVVAPGHCTGWRAKAALAHAFAPGRYGPSVVGTTYQLDSRTD